MQNIREFIKSKPHLVWSTTNYDNLSKESIVESVLNYGTWEDYIFLEKSLGLVEINTVFKEILNKRRVNLRPQTVNYFSKYFQKYA